MEISNHGGGERGGGGSWNRSAMDSTVLNTIYCNTSLAHSGSLETNSVILVDDLCQELDKE